MLIQSTLAWALALAFVIMTSSATSSSSSGSRSSTSTATGTTRIPHDKINALIAQAIVSALVSASTPKSNKVHQGKATVASYSPPPLRYPSQILGGVPPHIEIELDKVDIGGIALPELWALRANIKTAGVNYGNIKVFTKAGIS